jgi:drug/metabolite transporter (DMT)-like permease
VAVGITLVFWSSAFAGIRAGLGGGYSAGHLVLLRFFSASAVLALYACVRGVKIPARRDALRIVLLSFTGISIYHVALTYGELSVPAGTASILIAAAPAFTALLGTVVLGERLNAVGWLGICAGFCGVAVITFGSGPSQGFTHGALLILLSAVVTSLFFVFQKPLYQRYSAIELTSYFTWIGTVPMLWFLPGFWHDVTHATHAATLSGIYIGVFPAAVAYVAWAIALASSKASTVTSALYLNPVLAIGIAWVWLGELPHWISIIGGGLAIAGVIVVNGWGSAKSKPLATTTSDVVSTSC